MNNNLFVKDFGRACRYYTPGSPDMATVLLSEQAAQMVCRSSDPTRKLRKKQGIERLKPDYLDKMRIRQDKKPEPKGIDDLEVYKQNYYAYGQHMDNKNKIDMQLHTV